ncbi:MAG: aminodeoxychorismate synthase component I [Gemmatimonadales bacterium]
MSLEWAPLVENLGEGGDPVDVAERFLDLPFPLFLDSATGATPRSEVHPLGRYSFFSADPSIVIRSRDGVSEVTGPGAETTRSGTDPLLLARDLLGPFATAPVSGLPPFQGGAAGYIGYDYGSLLERLPAARHDDLGLPDVVLGIYDWVIAWDHRLGTAWVISTGIPETGAERTPRATARLDLVRERLRGSPRAGNTRNPRPSETAATPAPSYPVLGVDNAGAIGLRSTFTHRGYLDAVARVREYIVAGDIFQANLSQRFQAAVPRSLFDLYRKLRERNPAPFAAYLDFDEVTVLSASPERFLLLSENGRHVETRPIKGTRPRGLGPMHDAALGRALAESDKDRAENVMIVDLLRNDLSRVCRPGTVRVPELFALEHLPTVHHLVSTVVGELEPGADAVTLLRAAFPGGSITGAPKVRAMEIIAELEPTQRAVYCGSVGYLSVTGAMDTSIVIRTYVATGGQIYFQAGGGIVADSDPELEYRETLDKARALIEVLAS